jgi:hypothetical protein
MLTFDVVRLSTILVPQLAACRGVVLTDAKQDLRRASLKCQLTERTEVPLNLVD